MQDKDLINSIYFEINEHLRQIEEIDADLYEAEYELIYDDWAAEED